tara:strand:- start:718 stop:1746 length:1029 start_codon:yes stop_codon:yes gene_type:complete
MNFPPISIEKDIAVADTMPSYYYTENYFYKLTIDKIFKKSWQIITEKIDAKKVTPFSFLEDSINEPLILSYDRSYFLLSNVCTHRGNILCKEVVRKSKITCNYHGRTFSKKGCLINAPGFSQTKNFPKISDDLKSFPIKEWNNFLFCSLNPKINIDNVLNDIENRLIDFPFKQILFDESASNTYVLNANWALYCENYLEGLHVPFIHKGLNSDIDFKTYKTKILHNGVLQYTEDKNNNTYAYYYWIFPNIMLNFYSWGLSLNVIEPMGVDKTKIKFLSFPIKGNKQPLDTNSSLNVVEKEDQEVVINVQKGMSSLAYKRGRYSAEHEKGVHYFHQLISDFLR